jgi:plasmid maintenance system antidote protein VapI
MSKTKGPKRPSGIGEKLRGLIRANGYSIYQAAAAADIPNSALYEAVNETLPMSPATAARLHRIGIDGRALFLEQASLKLQRYEAEEAVLMDATERLCRAG